MDNVQIWVGLSLVLLFIIAYWFKKPPTTVINNMQTAQQKTPSHVVSALVGTIEKPEVPRAKLDMSTLGEVSIKKEKL